MKEFAVRELYQEAERSQVSMSAVEWAEIAVDQPECPIVIIDG